MNEKSYSVPIILISFAIPIVVAILYIMPKPDKTLGFDISILPAFHAILNSITTFTLMSGYYFIISKNKLYHKICMITSLVLSGLFLISYVIYHSLSEPTHFGGEGTVKMIYYFLLITHIIFAALIVPLVLITVSKTLTRRFDQHKKIARWALPIWLYVTITGVIVYFMIAPYY